MRTIIHINQHVIKANRSKNKKQPVITVKTYKSNKYASSLSILGPDGTEVARVVYRPLKPLKCGATCWIETECEVVIK